MQTKVRKKISRLVVAIGSPERVVTAYQKRTTRSSNTCLTRFMPLVSSVPAEKIKKSVNYFFKKAPSQMFAGS